MAEKISVEGGMKVNEFSFPTMQGMGGGVTHIEEPSDMAESLKHMNSDDVNPETKMSDIDMKTRLNDIEHEGLVTVDTLIALQFLPQSLIALTRQSKRLKVSKDGLGRREMIELVGGVRSQEQQGKGFLEKMMSGKK
jgi:hypothetical protein